MVRVLGIDPGSRVTGFGVIETDGVRSRYLGSGCIRTTSGPFPERLGEIFSGLRAALEEWRPGEVAVEQVFVSRNASSALKLGQARGDLVARPFQLGKAGVRPGRILVQHRGAGRDAGAVAGCDARRPDAAGTRAYDEQIEIVLTHRFFLTISTDWYSTLYGVTLPFQTRRTVDHRTLLSKRVEFRNDSVI